MQKLNNKEANYRLIAALNAAHGDRDEALRKAIGGEFIAFGILEREILIQYGLRPDGYVIDVGCGAGRLALPLSEYLTGAYLGIDIVPDLVEYGRDLVRRPDWRFEVATGFTIPEENGQADIVCFFSVLTHLLHEQSYVYLQEAKRVLKPTGKIIFSFLEFRLASHWPVFVSSVNDVYGGNPLNVFIERDAIDAWAGHLGLRVAVIHDGDKPHIALPHPLTLESGDILEEKAMLGQSICVLVHADT